MTVLNIPVTKKILKTIAIIIAAVLVIAMAFEYIILVSVARNGLKYVVDLQTHMKKIAVQPARGSLTIKGLKIYNPSGYKVKVLADVSRILMDFKLKTLLEPGAFLDRIEIHIEEINIIRDKDGVVNLSKMKALTPQEKPEKKKPFLADKYVIRIGKVYYIDRTLEEDKQIREIDLNVEEEYKNVTDPDNLARLIAYKIFFNGKVGNIGVDIQKIQADLAALAEKNKKLAEEMAQARQEQIDKAKEAVKETVEKAAGAMQEQVEKAKSAIGDKVESIKEKIQAVGNETAQ